MYKETNSNSKKIFWKIVLFLIVMTIFYCGVNLPILARDVIFTAFAVWFVMYLIKNHLTTYDYELFEDKIVITAHLGERIRGQAVAMYCAIKLFDLEKSEKIKNIKCPCQILCASGKEKYAIVFENDNGKNKVVFAPSEQLAGMLKEKIELHTKEE